MSTEHVWLRYLPGLVAAVGGTAIITSAPPLRRIAFTVLATLLGLFCMEAEYWLAFGFPKSEVTFFVFVVVITLAALAVRKRSRAISACGTLKVIPTHSTP